MALLHKGSLAEEALGQLFGVVVSCKRNNRRNHKMGHTTSGRHLDMLAPQGMPSSLLLDPDFGIHPHKVRVVAGPAPPVLLLAPVERPVWGLVPSEVRRQV